MSCKDTSHLNAMKFQLKIARLKYRHANKVVTHSDRGKHGRGDGFFTDQLRKLNRNIKNAAAREGVSLPTLTPKTFQRIVKQPMKAFRVGTRPSLLNLYQQVGLLEGINSRADQ